MLLQALIDALLVLVARERWKLCAALLQPESDIAGVIRDNTIDAAIVYEIIDDVEAIWCPSRHLQTKLVCNVDHGRSCERNPTLLVGII